MRLRERRLLRAVRRARHPGLAGLHVRQHGLPGRRRRRSRASVARGGASSSSPHAGLALRSRCCAAAARWSSRRRCWAARPKPGPARSSTRSCPPPSRRCGPTCRTSPNSPAAAPCRSRPTPASTHYYGVGAYRRPLEDARRAEVRFASECLAFANVPDAATLRRAAGAGPAVAPPALEGARAARRRRRLGLRGRARPLPRRCSSAWTRSRCATEDPERYLDLVARGRRGEVMAATFAEWRRARLAVPRRAGLVPARPVAGRGLGRRRRHGAPKAAYYALRRAFRPVQVALTDEGVNGLAIHLDQRRAARPWTPS